MVDMKSTVYAHYIFIHFSANAANSSEAESCRNRSFYIYVVRFKFFLKDRTGMGKMEIETRKEYTVEVHSHLGDGEYTNKEKNNIKICKLN